jgi:serine/threonine protein kinase
MTPQEWQRVRSLFDRAAELPNDARERLLADADRGCPALAAEVRSLLAHDRPEDWTDEGTADRLAGSLAPAAPVPSVIGRYRLLREIGRGGMSVVYLAERADRHYRQRVAIKLLRLGCAPSPLADRLRQERQFLADLDHPNIARLLDGGDTADGLPYLVMEHIAGLPIDRFCRAHRLAPRARLRLFRVICDAVHHAHRQGIVHRDLKPGNLLVTAAGVPKLLDFGVAERLHPPPTHPPPTHPPATRRPANHAAGRWTALTAGYASPEQWRGEPASIASDVYSLGVLLHELLAGQRPGEAEPLRPSTIPPHLPPAVPAPVRAAGRAIGLDPDLDAIVCRALREAPDHRYRSVAQLAADLDRYLAHRPVSARPTTLGYRLAKWLWRHRWTASAALASALVAGGLTRLATGRSRRPQPLATAGRGEIAPPRPAERWSVGG